MTREPTIDVAIPTWNRAELLADCLERLEDERTPHRVIVADNGSTDSTAALVRDRFPESLLVALDVNLGFGRAVNAAAAAGESEVIVVINNDVFVQPGFLAALAAPFSDPRVGMVSGVLIDSATGRIDAAGLEIDRTIAGYSALRGEPLEALARGTPGGLIGPCGGAAAYRRTAFEQAGGFDPEIFAYFEDVDLALRLIGAGWRGTLAADARAMHLGSATLGARSVVQVRHYAWARGYVLGRHRAGAGSLALEAAIATVDAGVLRSVAPLAARVSGWRRGRALGARVLPPEAARLAIPLRDGLARRRAAARGGGQRRGRVRSRRHRSASRSR